MGGITTPTLAAAVASEGGLGMIAAAGLPADMVVAQLRDALDLASDGAPIGVNFVMPFLDERALQEAAAIAHVVECFYGDPHPAIVERIHNGGALATRQIGSLDEARAAADAGCDLIVVQGREAGGHVRGTTPLGTLLRDVRNATQIPLVAAGGIGSGAAMAAALLGGADAVRVGTRFVATVEADVHHDYAAALVAAGADDTILTEAFSLGWPNAPHRVLRRCVDTSDLEPTQRSPSPPTRDFLRRRRHRRALRRRVRRRRHRRGPSRAGDTRPHARGRVGAPRCPGQPMIRTIDGFHQDEAGDWVAQLSCLHNQHVRHSPPFQERPWVVSEEGRVEHLGAQLECPLCDRLELPDGLAVARTAGPFDAETLPPALQRKHLVAERTWGLLRVLEGAVVFAIETTPPTSRRIGHEEEQPIPPGIPHLVRVDEPMRLAVDFLVKPRV